jgi:DNA-binding transcriptional ArsR family regulator
MATIKSLDIKTVEKVAKALGDKNRLMILLHITKQGGCAPCADMSDVVPPH